MNKIFFSLITTILLSPNISWSFENLDEMMVRMTRQATATWGYQYFEDPNNYYFWQPETLTYNDTTTGHEVWVLVRQPQGQDIYSREYGINAWSFDGSRIGFFDISTRDTGNPELVGGNERGTRRFIVNTDGSKLRAIEGYGKYQIPLNGYNWAHTENAYYAFGTHSVVDAPTHMLYKMNIDENNRATNTLILDTSPVNMNYKQLIKEGISTVDSWIVARDFVYVDDSPCTKRTTGKIYFIQLDDTPEVDHYWGVSRGIGPEADPYGNHTIDSEEHFHDVWSPGPNPQWIIGVFSGVSTIWVTMNKSGSCEDGGPLWEDWDGDSFGQKEEIRVVSSGAGTPVNPYNLPYFGHPVFDRWGRYTLIGTYTDNPKPGTRIVDTSTWTLLPHYVLAYNQYDGQHHSWTGWTDYVLAVEPDWPLDNPKAGYINANKWDKEYTEAITVVNTNYPGYSGNYNGYPRPSQSPDGTKVTFSTTWLNSTDDKYPYISWAVVHYPHPPKILSATQAGTTVRISWGWDAGNLYTTRGWPNEATDPPPLPREIKAYHVWTATDQTDWTELTTNGVNYGTNFFDITQPPGTTRFYAVTSEEHSRLESRTLSNIWQVTLDASGVVTQSTESAPYPNTPGGITPFYQNSPDAPRLLSVTPGAHPGHYLLKWKEPKIDASKIRYYNIYYSTSGNLTPDNLTAKTRIASVPVGTDQWLDWNADPLNTSSSSYRITSVDRQGNEGVLPRP